MPSLEPCTHWSLSVRERLVLLEVPMFAVLIPSSFVVQQIQEVSCVVYFSGAFPTSFSGWGFGQQKAFPSRSVEKWNGKKPGLIQLVKFRTFWLYWALVSLTGWCQGCGGDEAALSLTLSTIEGGSLLLSGGGRLERKSEVDKIEGQREGPGEEAGLVGGLCSRGSEWELLGSQRAAVTVGLSLLEKCLCGKQPAGWEV